MSWFPDVAGGLNRYLADLHNALLNDGKGPPPHTVLLGPCAAPAPGVLAVSDHCDALPRRWLHLALTAKAIHADVIDAHFALYAIPIVLGSNRRQPLVVHFQGPWADESASSGAKPLSSAAKRWVEKRVYRRAIISVTLSHAFKRILVESYGVAPWDIRVIPPMVDRARFCPGDRLEARRWFGIPDDAAVIATVRRLIPRMGVDVLLEAWLRTIPAISTPSARGVMIGEPRTT